MTDKTFEEQFPSLLNGVCYENVIDCYEEDNPMLGFQIGLNKEDIQKYCLDKQRVKDAIKKHEKVMRIGGQNRVTRPPKYVLVSDFIKELRLD